MKLKPKAAYVTLFDDKFNNPVPEDERVNYIIECCDSVMAVLNDSQLAEWIALSEEYTADPNAREYTDGFATLVFDVKDEQLVVVADTGGEYLSGGPFLEFCEDRGIDFQTMVDSLDVTDVPVREIYTGAETDNRKLLRLLHKVFN